MIIDTFEYDTYGKLLNHTGNIDTPFLYNGRDGVMTDHNGLIYMRNRYYSPILRRFVNADVLHGEISDSTSLNRYAYVNGNPVSFIDPLGFSAERGETTTKEDVGEEIIAGSNEYYAAVATFISEAIDFKGDVEELFTYIKGLELEAAGVRFVKNGDFVYILGDTQVLRQYGITKSRVYDHKLGKYAGIANMAYPPKIFKSALKDSFDAPGLVFDIIGIGAEAVYEASQYETFEDRAIVGGYTVVAGAASTVASTVASASAMALTAKIATMAGTAIAPGVGTVVGLVAGIVVGGIVDWAFGLFRKTVINDIVENN